MHRLARSVVATTLMSTSAASAHAADYDALIKCLREKVMVSNPTFMDIGNQYVNFDVTNNLPFAIKSVIVKWEVREKGRSVPTNEQDQALLRTDRGAEPGETQPIGDMLSHEMPLEGATAKVELLDVITADDLQVAGFAYLNAPPKETAPFSCP